MESRDAWDARDEEGIRARPSIHIGECQKMLKTRVHGVNH
jgi:hypothetical protein